MIQFPWVGSMTLRQAVVVVAGLSWLIPSCAIWLMYPQYLVDGKWQHRSVFDPPSIPVGNGYDLLDPEDLERLSKDPRQAEILANMREMPREVPLRPSWIGGKYGDSRNALFGVFLLALTAFIIALKIVGIL